MNSGCCSDEYDFALQVASREAPFLNEPSDFNYSVGDARVLATRAPVASGPILPYGGQDLTGAGGGGAGDVLATPYRSSAYPYAVASAPTKTYYPAPSQYSPQYGDEFDYGLGVTAQPVLSSDTVAMLPSQWSSSSRTTKSSSACGTAMYMDAAAAAAAASSYGGYGGPSLVHRPAPQVSVGSESTSLSLSGFGAELPSTSPADRVLPNPTSRTPLPYPGGGGGGGSSGMKSPIQSAVTGTGGTSTLADVAAAASYVGGYDNNGLSAAYTSVASSSSSLSGHHHHHHHHHLPNSSRAGSDTPYGPGESLFGEQERGLQHPGSAFDMSAYTAGSRRDSLSSAGHSGSSSSGQTASCVPTEPLHASSPVVAGYVGDHHPSPTSPHSHHRHSLSLSLSHRGLVTGGSNNNSTTASSSSSTIIGGGGGAIGATSHADNHRVAVATRR